ncbi:hypothetical protein M2322_003212 [Rhodoblastus acidophilus]|uniref:toxin glutamine deamidase domain-containing protein n=1 Tax=Rhodoblastus acidophilus TaxID=1074 RepID=UPI002225224B|nr:hypothetical protein [Rhodoblastus acidophilus]
MNPKNDQQNCGFVIDAVAARPRGKDRSAVAQSGRDGAWDEIESRFNPKITWDQKIDDAYSQVKQAGDGALAIVGIRYPDGAGPHVVVIGNDSGKVGIVEAQDWGNGQKAGVIYSAKAANARYNSDGKSVIGIGLLPKSDRK